MTKKLHGLGRDGMSCGKKRDLQRFLWRHGQALVTNHLEMDVIRLQNIGVVVSLSRAK